MEETKYCPRCERTLPLAKFYKAKNRKNNIRANCVDCDRVIKASRTRILRTKIYDILGHACVRCGFTDKRALQIDHVFGGGNQEHAKIKNPDQFIRKVMQDTSGTYQLLCANCNWIKRFERQEIARPSVFTPEQEQKILMKPEPGRPVSEGTRLRLSESCKGKPAWNIGVPAWNRGVPRTEEEKLKMGRARKETATRQSPEERSAIAKRREAARTPEQRSEQRKKAAKTRRDRKLAEQLVQ